MFLSTVLHSGRLQPPQTPSPPPSSCGSGNVAASVKGSQTGQETQAVRQSNQVLTVPLPHQNYLEEEIMCRCKMMTQSVCCKCLSQFTGQLNGSSLTYLL